MSLFHHADSSTDVLPNCGPSWGSTTSEAASEAVRQAATKLADSLRDKFEVEVDDEEKPGSKKKKTLTWKEVIQSVHPSVGFSASKIPLTAYSFYDGTERHSGGQGKNALSYNGYGVAVTEAEVDSLTGEVRIARADIMLDAGASLNPALDSGQIEGGYVQGLGLALSEAVRVDLRTGACATSTWQYKVPTADGCPRVLKVHLLPAAKHARGILSSKAVGEPPLLLASTALCAIQAACDAAKEGFASKVGGNGNGGGGALAAKANGTIENRSKGGPSLSAPRSLLTAPATPAAVKAAIGLVPLAEMVAGGPAGKL
jgi:xanthine dehydrogenase molybdopterin-binding subunit B